MTDQIRFDGKVVVITGAGNGLGRSYALLFGARGAKVVVNDLGGGRHGDGKSSAAADKVVEEIRAIGGEAVATFDSVEDGDKIVRAAVDAFGTIDIVINNAGILRDVSFHKMSREDWERILRVHLYGSFRVTHAAWPILRDKGYGRVIFTSSAAGIYGNFGQANYSAAKLGLYGLANTLAIEGRPKGIHVNTIAPIAASRLTETILPPELIAALKPEYVAPLVAWLCHESCAETGGLFEVGASYCSKLRWERSRGHLFGAGRELRPEELAAEWGAISDFADSEHPTSIDDTFGRVTAAAKRKTLGGNEFINLDTASVASTTVESSYDERDLALYALGVGAAADAVDEKELAFVYERDERFAALPTYAVMPASNAMIRMLKEGKGMLPGLNFGFERLLHGEQYTEIKAPLPRAAKLTHVFKLKAAYDKNPHAVTVLAISTRTANGEEIAYNEFTAFVRGAGGWGGERGPDGEINSPPAREPDVVIEEKTAENQALLYRLSGDWNPLHADPAYAQKSGYERPILHGLCTYGYVGRHVLKAFCDNDPRRFKSLKVRFAEPLFPGETLVTSLWQESPTRIVFEVKAKERDKLVIKNAVAELHEPPVT
jgi:(3R)-3-hydroxyacyl-CoA dehydrogenase / 3a,7a,12a-trihydroxy-5b-cholest-24-enoyl-CoA hydratase / enoyl-CoA hydratase 2